MAGPSIVRVGRLNLARHAWLLALPRYFVAVGDGDRQVEVAPLTELEMLTGCRRAVFSAEPSARLIGCRADEKNQAGL